MQLLREEIQFRDAYKLASWEAMRSGLYEWKYANASVAGCLQLYDGVLVAPPISPLGFLDSNAPLLTIVEDLVSNGWTFGAKNVLAPICDAEPNVMWIRMLEKRCKPYFQCIQASGLLISKGLGSLLHDQKVIYYRLLLVSDNPGQIVLDASVAVYKKMLDSRLEQLGGDLDSGVLCDASSCSSQEGGCNVGYDSEYSVLQGALPVGASAIVCSQSSEGGDDDTTAEFSKLSSVKKDPPAAAGDLVALFGEGVLVDYSSESLARKIIFKYESGRATENSKSYSRYFVRCPDRSHGKNCTRRRNVSTRSTTPHGAQQVPAFLLAWADGAAGRTFLEHKHYEPAPEDVEAALVRLRAEPVA